VVRVEGVRVKGSVFGVNEGGQRFRVQGLGFRV
jgi:hypothetical protein